MTQQSVDPVPNTPILDDPTKDAILKRWLAKLFRRVATTGQIDHNTLLNLNVGDYRHLTAARNTTLTGTQPANKVLAGPATGADTISAFRALVAADLPAGIGTVTDVTGTTPIASSGGTTPAISLNANSITPAYLSGDMFAFASAMG
jgi:hypothetical protein